MDLSKLPKLSGTTEPTAPAGTENPPTSSEPTLPAAIPQPSAQASPHFSPSNQESPSYRTQGPFSAGDLWVSVIFGIILLFLGGGFGSYAICLITRTPHHTKMVWPDSDDKAGQEVAYPDCDDKRMWSESSLFLTGTALLLDVVASISLFKGLRFARQINWVSLALTVLATGLCLFASAVLNKANILPILSLLGAAVGGYTAFARWAMLSAIVQKNKTN